MIRHTFAFDNDRFGIRREFLYVDNTGSRFAFSVPIDNFEDFERAMLAELRGARMDIAKWRSEHEAAAK